MPQAGSIVEFKYGNQAAYDTCVKNNNVLYFCSDSRRFFVGSEEYTRTVKQYTKLPIENISPNTLCVISGENDLKELYVTYDGIDWDLLSILPPKVYNGIIGDNSSNLEPKFGENIHIPKIKFGEKGYIEEVEDQEVKLPTIQYIDIEEALDFKV